MDTQVRCPFGSGRNKAFHATFRTDGRPFIGIVPIPQAICALPDWFGASRMLIVG